VGVGRDVEVGAVPDEVGVIDAVAGERAVDVDDEPVGVVEGGGGEAGVVAGVDEPVGGEVDGVGDVDGFDVVGVEGGVVVGRGGGVGGGGERDG
jgi:hypothetical protein